MENRLTAYISIWGSLILANLFTNKWLTLIMIIQAVLLLFRYIWLCTKD